MNSAALEITYKGLGGGQVTDIKFLKFSKHAYKNSLIPKMEVVLSNEENSQKTQFSLVMQTARRARFDAL